MPSRCLIIGTRASFMSRSIRLLPPRGTITSTYSVIVISLPTAARSDVATTCTASCGKPAASSASPISFASAVLHSSASEPPRRIVALPDLRQSAAASIVTLRTRFVDDADHAERHAHLPDPDAARPVLQIADLADRIGERRDRRRPSTIVLSALSDSVRRSMKAAS